ncbi:MAG: ABC transporter permease [Treponemataceae bacterium]|nr:MAG: ABC transporter permease [Treponemataceae bacterium]
MNMPGKFLSNKFGMTGLGILLLLCVFSLIGPLFSKRGRDEIDIAHNQSPPGNGYILGADELGRDVFTRLAHGGRVSISVGLIAMTIQLVIGVSLGTAAGFFGGIWDSVIMRLTDIIMCFPFYVIALSVAALTGPSFRNVILIIGLLGWPQMARIARSNTLSLKNTEFIEAARALGLSRAEIIFKHILPNSAGPIIIYGTITVANAVLIESSLSFLGLGIAPPQPSWGTMLTQAQNLNVLQRCWWMWMPAGLLILLSVLAVNFIGEGLSEILDSKK